MLKACPTCGRVTDGRYCGQHQPPQRSQWSPDRDHASHARFARAIRKRAQGRCEICGSTDRVQAHHRTPLAAGGTDHPDNGILLCNAHHRELDPHAR
jgi:predicted restriction endonuclease